MPRSEQKFYHVTQRYFLWVLFAILLAVLISDFFALRHFYYIIWGDREISRSITLGEYFPVSGAELNGRGGGRIPGGALHYVSYLFLSMNPSPKFVHMATGTLALLSSWFLFNIGRLVCNTMAGAAAALVFLTSSYTLTNIFSFWNPLYALPFLVAGFCSFSIFLINKRALYFLLTVITLAVATQMHMASLYTVIFLIFYMIVSGISVSKKTILYSFMIVLILYLPWIVNYLFGVPEEGPSMPPVVPSLFKSNEPITGLGFELSYALKNLVLRLNAIDFGEPKFLTTVFPIGAFVSGVAALIFGKWPKTSLSHQAISARQYTYFLIYFITMGALLTGITVDLVGEIGLKKPRYYMYLLPAIALLSGISFATIFDAILTKPRNLLPYLIFGILTISFLARSSTTIYSNYKRPLIKLHSSPLYNDIETVIKDIHQTFGLGSESIKIRTSYLITDGDDWYSKIQPLNYVLQFLDLKDKSSPYKGCVFVLARPKDLTVDAQFDEKIIKKAITKLPLMKGQKNLYAELAENWHLWGKIQIDTLRIRPKYALVGAKLTFSGCPKSFMNPYIPSPKEIMVQKKLAGKNDAVITDIDKNEFYIRYNSGKIENDINLMVKLFQNNPSTISVEVQSKQLRNSGSYLGGYYRPRSIFASSLIFKSLETNKRNELVVFPSHLGRGPYTTPWRIENYNLEPGRYSIWLLFSNSALHLKKKQKILLTNSYRIN